MDAESLRLSLLLRHETRSEGKMSGDDSTPVKHGIWSQQMFVLYGYHSTLEDGKQG